MDRHETETQVTFQFLFFKGPPLSKCFLCNQDVKKNPILFWESFHLVRQVSLKSEAGSDWQQKTQVWLYSFMQIKIGVAPPAWWHQPTVRIHIPEGFLPGKTGRRFGPTAVDVNILHCQDTAWLFPSHINSDENFVQRLLRCFSMRGRFVVSVLNYSH